MTSFIPNFLPAFAANLTAMMIKAAGSEFRERFSPAGVQEAVKRCVEHGITALISSSDELSSKNEHILIDCFDDYFQYRSVVRELSKILRGKKPDVDELIFLFEEEAGYDLDVLPGLDINQGMQAFIGAFMTSAILEPELNRIIQAEQLIKQTEVQQDILEEVRRLIEFLRKDGGQQVVGIRAGQIEARNVVNGTQIIYEMAARPDIPIPENTEEQHYLRTLIEKCDVLQLAVIDESCTADDAIRISDVFTSMNLTRQRFPDQSVEDVLTRRKDMDLKRESSDKPVSIQAVEAAGSMQRLVILGQPGSGKSTLVNYIASRLALRCLADGEISTEVSTDLPGFTDDETPLPVRIILRHFAAWIPSGTKKSAGLVWDYIKHMLDQWGCSCYEDVRLILQNRGGVIFFDGLDEVSEIDEDSKRSIITESIQEFSRPLLDKCRVIITCREYAYKNTDGWRLPEKFFPVSELALFDMEQIRAFTHIWYQVIGPQKEWGEAKQKAEAENLYSAIDALPYLKEIAQYPLLLTLMAQVHGRDGSLPKDRADLYERAVNLLLEHWDNRLIRDDASGTCRRESGLILRLGIRRDTLRSVLEKLAFTAHEYQEAEKGQTGQCADINKLDLLEAFKDELGSLDKAENVIEYIRERAGLLTAQDNRTYTFPHRTFQEYLAAAHIMKQGEFDEMLFERVKRDLNWWREVFLLAAGYSKSVPRNVSNMIDVMLAHKPEDSSVTLEQAGFAQLAAQALVETDFINFVEKEKKETGQGRFSRIFERIQMWLVESLKADETLKPVERVKSGRSLAELGDPRKEVMTLEHMEFCLVPAGVFFMGDGQEKDLIDFLDYDYWISRHPVTNAQYDEFVRAGGYEQRQYWKEAEKEAFWKSGNFKGNYDRSPRNRPFNHGSPFNLSNHPVVGLTWYESLAFTRWLTDFWKEQGIIGAKRCICLPSEAEWEKAARGGQKIPGPVKTACALEKAWDSKANMIVNPDSEREYPWVGKIDVNKVNYRDTGIESTSSAGCFSSGMSPYGCLDMSGNVWEWTRSLWGKKYPYNPTDGRENESEKRNIARVVRGGSCFNSSDLVLCAARNRYDPDLRHYFRGFRVLCAPNSVR
ncbi:SUMF1/EgtB/PvdO family nonheme iron enzyme [Desulfobacterales bacterium HSG17]|nr:SUMF1/EgtB/PvdO family nonheme iron enzyme [Desulfobacterales bacterium HSG17]